MKSKLYSVNEGRFYFQNMYNIYILFKRLSRIGHKFLIYFLCPRLLSRPMLLYFYDMHNFYRLLPIITLANPLKDKMKYKWNLTFELLIELRPCPCLLSRLLVVRIQSYYKEEWTIRLIDIFDSFSFRNMNLYILITEIYVHFCKNCYLVPFFTS